MPSIYAIVERINLLIVKNNRRQATVAQLWFRGTTTVRTVIIKYRSPLASTLKVTPEYASWGTFKFSDMPDLININEPDGYEFAEAILSDLVTEEVWHREVEPNRPTQQEAIKQRRAIREGKR